MSIFKAGSALVVSMIILYLAQEDMGGWGVVFWLTVFTGLIFVEFCFIRQTLVDVYAEAITENRYVLFFLRSRFTNYPVALIISIFLALYLLIHINIPITHEHIHPLPRTHDHIPYQLLPFLIAGILLSWLLQPLGVRLSGLFKKRPALVFTRLSGIFIVVCLVVILDGVYNAFDIDNRIQERFDISIPKYVIHDISHSYKHFQDLLRTLLYVDLNIQSIIGFREGSGEWRDYLLKFIACMLSLSPTPYIAYTLTLLSLRSLEIEIRRVIRQ